MVPTWIATCTCGWVSAAEPTEELTRCSILIGRTPRRLLHTVTIKWQLVVPYLRRRGTGPRRRVTHGPAPLASSVLSLEVPPTDVGGRLEAAGDVVRRHCDRPLLGGCRLLPVGIGQLLEKSRGFFHFRLELLCERLCR